MKYTLKDFVDFVMRHLKEMKEFEKEVRARSARGEMLHEMTETFAEFVEKFLAEERGAVYALLFMMGINIAMTKPRSAPESKTVFEVVDESSTNKPKKKSGKEN